MKNFFLFLIPLSFAFASPVIAQVEEEDELLGSRDTLIHIDERRFIYKGNIYRQNSPYFTMGYGVGMNLGKESVEQNTTFSYHHFVKGIGIGLGYHMSSDGKTWWRSYQKLKDLHFMLGKRWEGVHHNLSLFAGPSYAHGSYIGWNEEFGENRAYDFRTAGMVAEVQYSYRIFYDIGLGISAYTSLNKFTKVVGGQIHIFFSTAFVRSYD